MVKLLWKRAPVPQVADSPDAADGQPASASGKQRKSPTSAARAKTASDIMKKDDEGGHKPAFEPTPSFSWEQLWRNPYKQFCFAAFLFIAFLEMLRSVLWSLIRCSRVSEDKPHVAMVDTPGNRELCNACPSLQCFKPLWWARGGHAQTALLGSFNPKYRTVPRYRREAFMLADGVEVALDWKDLPHMGPDTPLVFCCHGLGSSSEAPYLQMFTGWAVRQGYRVLASNRRGHAGMSLLPKPVPSDQQSGGGARPKPAIFPRHDLHDDMQQVVEYVLHLYPHAPKYLIGFSAGGNHVANYLGRMGPDSPFLAACSISNGFDILTGTSILKQRTRIGDGIIMNFLMDLLYEGRKEEVEHLAKEAGVILDLQKIMRSRSLHEFEEQLVLPSHLLKSLEEYYNADSCASRLKDIRSPLLCVSTTDDPLVPAEMAWMAAGAARGNEHIITAITSVGGHLGWFDGTEVQWCHRLFFEFIKAVSEQQGSPHALPSPSRSAAAAALLEAHEIPDMGAEALDEPSSGEAREARVLEAAERGMAC